jgi:TatA/E family protein of Tat protein translocase
MPNIGLPEIIVILVIALIVVGPGRLPDVGAALGKSIREFRKASSDISDAARIDAPVQQPTAPVQTAAPAQTAAPVQTAAPAPTPEPSVPTPTSTTVPAPIAAPPDPADDEPTNLPA